MPCDQTRRGFLGLIGAGAAVTALLPRIRAAHAMPGPQARARRVLVLNLVGALRSSAAFHASATTRYNPYGQIAGTGTPFALGRILDDTPPGSAPLPDAAYTLSAAWQNARLPRLREIAKQMSVLGTWSLTRGDHQRARIEETTGSATGQDPGLLTRIAAGLGAGGADLAIPPFHLEAVTLFGNAQGAMARYAPVALASYEALPSAATVDTTAVARTGHWFGGADPARSLFDDQRVARRAGRGQLVAQTYQLHKHAAHTVGTRLSQPDIAVGSEAGDAAALGTVRLASDVPLTNAMLREAMLSCVGPNPDSSPFRTMAIDAALAVRMLQLGSPAVVLELSDFDFHSGERTQGPPLYGFVGRLWATLSWLLARIPDPSGEGTLFDRTLVTTFSDFGRDGADGGWNGGEGTDHGLDASCFYLAHAVMGGRVTGNKLVGGVSTTTYDARNEPVQIAPQRYMATLLDALGLDSTNPEWGFPEAGAPVGELWT